MMDRKSWGFIVVVFAAFAALAAAIYFFGKRMHADGEGLATHESKEFIIQVSAKSIGIQGIDFRSQVPAFRLRSGQSRDIFLVLRNLQSKESVSGKLSGKFHPLNEGAIEMSPLTHEVRLGPHEERSVPFRISLGENPPHTIDGTIDWKVELSPI